MEEAAIVALRVQARLPLDDVFIALKDVIPNLTRSSLHRCLQRHGISRLPKADREKPKTFKKYEIGYFHIDIAELCYEGGKGFLYVAVDRRSEEHKSELQSLLRISYAVFCLQKKKHHS